VSFVTEMRSTMGHGGRVKASRRAVSRFVVLGLALGAAMTAGTGSAQTPAEPRYESTVDALLDDPAGRAFLEAYRAVTRSYLGEAEPNALLDGAIRGLVAALDDPYVTYLDAEEASLDAPRRRDPNVIVTATLGDLGYLRVLSFDSERAGERFSTELDALIVRGVRGVVLDLRGNDGGFVLTGLQVLDRFLSDVVLGYRSTGQGALPLGFANPRALGLPLAVLIDGDTASTAEIVAGALQSYGRARLFGEISAGKGVGQSTIHLSNGGELRLVTFAWLLPDGRSIDGWGLTPDVPMLGSVEAETIADLTRVIVEPDVDPALAAALRALRRDVGDELEGLSTEAGPDEGEAMPDLR
jgi:C-terminal processing protease CtpA/Prc